CRAACSIVSVSTSLCRKRKKSIKFTTLIWMLFTTVARLDRSTVSVKLHAFLSSVTVRRLCCWLGPTCRWYSMRTTPAFQQSTVRRFISRQLRKDCLVSTPRQKDPKQVYVRFGSKADMCNAQAHVRFGPIADSCSAEKIFVIR